MARVSRPLAPHVGIYRWQLTSVLSILHRVSGMVLGVGTLLLTWWLIAAVEGPEAFARMQGIMSSWLGRLVLLAFSLALFYHLCNGIRHLFWDFGYGFELRTVYRSGRTVVAATVVLTLLSWLIGYAVRGV